jgi:hypothetical protein
LAQVLEGEAQAAADEAGEQAGGAEGEPPPPKVGQDFSPTLYALDPDEKVQLQRALASEMSRDLRHDVLAALFDRLEEPEYPDRKTEIIKIFRGLLPSLLSRGDVEYAANILEELALVRAEARILDEICQKECDELLDDISSTETIEELVRGLQDGTIDVSVEELARLLRFLRAGALPVLLLAAEQEELPALKQTLRDAVHGIAEENPEAVLSLLEDRDPVVTSGAVRLVGRMGIAEASPKLAGLMNHPDAGVRLALIETIQLLADVTTPETLIGALSDDDRDVCVAAAGALAELGVETAAPALEALVTGKEIRQADLTEKIAIFESYGILGGSGATDVLNEILNKKGFLGRREPSQIRASAARALGKGGLPGAHEALLAAQRDTDAVVRTAVRQALEGVGEEAE